MPLKSQYARRQVNRVFTNRESHIAHFNQKRYHLQRDQHGLLGFYGVGGQGKTWLCRRLQQELSPNLVGSSGFGHVDFQTPECQRADKALLQLRRSIRASGKIAFPAFDIAIRRYWEVSYPEDDIQQALKDVLDDSSGIFAEVADAIKDLPGKLEDAPVGIGFTVKTLNYIRQKGYELHYKKTIEALAGLEILSSSDLLAKLPYFFAVDLQSFLDKHPDNPPVIFMDTYEELWTAKPNRSMVLASETDAWVRELIAASPGVLFVVFGRDKLVWDQVDNAWQDILHDQRKLDGLLRQDADKFLQHIPIADAAIRLAMIEAAIGAPDLLETAQQRQQRKAHPFYLDMTVNLYIDIEDQGRSPQTDDFGGSHQEVTARFLRHRSQAELATLKALAIPRWFDYPLFCDLVTAFHTQYPLTEFAELTAFSFIEPQTDGRFQLHALMREALRDLCDAETRTRLQQFLFARYDALCQPESVRDVQASHEQALVEACYHYDITHLRQFLRWFYSRSQIFNDAARFTVLIDLYERLLGLIVELHPGRTSTLLAQITWDFELLTIETNLASLLQHTNRLSEAEFFLKSALGTAENWFGAFGADANESSTVAMCLNNFAMLLKDTNRLAEAEPLIRRALAIDEASFGADHPTVARDLNNLAALLQATNRLAEAEPLMQRALAIEESNFGENHPRVSTYLNNLAQLLQATNRLAEAEPLILRALAIDEASFGADHPNVARDLNNLATLLQVTNRLAEAEPILRRALAIFETSLVRGHPNILTVGKNLVVQLMCLSREDEAETLQQYLQRQHGAGLIKA